MAFKHLLVPTDFSEPNEALRYAVEEATLHRARVTLLHVLPPDAHTNVHFVGGEPGPASPGTFNPEVGGHIGGASILAHAQAVRRDPSEEALTRLRDLAANAFTGPSDAEVAEGHPADAIVRIARERSVDLIVMSTVAEKVVRLAPCPVLTVKRGGASHA
jgi:nucleotide-binding universal stress UspA family protein